MISAKITRPAAERPDWERSRSADTTVRGRSLPRHRPFHQRPATCWQAPEILFCAIDYFLRAHALPTHWELF